MQTDLKGSALVDYPIHSVLLNFTKEYSALLSESWRSSLPLIAAEYELVQFVRYFDFEEVSKLGYD